MIYLTEKSADCNARLVIGGRRTSVVAKNFSPNWIRPGTENASKGSAFCVFRGV